MKSEYDFTGGQRGRFYRPRWKRLVKSELFWLVVDLILLIAIYAMLWL